MKGEERKKRKILKKKRKNEKKRKKKRETRFSQFLGINFFSSRLLQQQTSFITKCFPRLLFSLFPSPIFLFFFLSFFFPLLHSSFLFYRLYTFLFLVTFFLFSPYAFFFLFPIHSLFPFRFLLSSFLFSIFLFPPFWAADPKGTMSYSTEG